MNLKSKALTVILSFLPGLGHMYLGYTNYGVQMMLTFFLLTWVSSIIPFAGVAIVVLWFYSIFDAIKKCEKVNMTTLSNPSAQPDDIHIGLYAGLNFANKNIWLIICAAVLILIGANIMLTDVFDLNIPRRIIDASTKFILSGALIVGGGYLLYRSTKGNKDNDKKNNPLEPDYTVGQATNEEKINKEDK